jgi:HSP20 family protein
MSEVQVTKGGRLPLDVPEVFRPLIPIGDVFGVNPFGLMKEFASEMHRAWSVLPREIPEGWMPVMEVKHTDGIFSVTAELPGVKKEEIKVETAGNVLTIEGERKHEKKEERAGFFRSERSYGKFYRAIPLPEGAKVELAKAELVNGVLEITVPVPEMKPGRKQIPVNERNVKETVTH